MFGRLFAERILRSLREISLWRQSVLEGGALGLIPAVNGVDEREDSDCLWQCDETSIPLSDPQVSTPPFT